MDVSAFERYPKIPETTQGWSLAPEEWRRLERLEWVVTEKIHGANCSWLTDGREVRPARRKAMLEAGEDFFGIGAIQERLQEAILRLFEACHAVVPGCTSIQLYGELFGGGYPHPDVLAVPGVMPIQTGVYYSPDVAFCAFDLAVNASSSKNISSGISGAGGSGLRFLDYDVAMSCFEEVGLFYAKPLFVGRFAEACSYPHVFPSTLPGALGLPPLSEANLAEGVVMKPLSGDIWIETPKGRVRPLIKHKIDAFAEDQRYHQAQKWEDASPQPVMGPDMAEDPLGFLEWQMLMMATPGRLDNAISKVGTLSTARRDAIAKELTADIWEALEEAYGALLGRLALDDAALLQAVLSDTADALISSRL